MGTLKEGKHAGGFIVSLASGTRSMGSGTILHGEVLVAGELVGQITATKKYKAYNNTATDGTQTVAGIIYDNIDATDGDIKATLVVRDAEVRGSDLTYNTIVSGEITTAEAELKNLGLIIR